jgi:hypothetical protein
MRIYIMAKDWIERRNDLFAAQARQFCETIAADPAAYQISAGDAALLLADYADFAAKQVLAEQPLTRTRVAVSARDAARKTLSRRMRDLGGRIRSNLSISTAAKLVLSLNIPGTTAVALPGAPTTRPFVHIASVIGNVLTVRLKEEDSSRAGKPAYVIGAEVFYQFGEEPPTHGDGWRRGALTMSAKARIILPTVPPGTQMWICARWFNTHGSGPASNVMSTHLGKVMEAPGMGLMAA